MLYVKLFGYALALGVLASSVAMAALGGRFQRIEQAAYAGQRRPWWFWAGSAVLIVLYLGVLVSFIQSDARTWAGWALAIVIPAGWVTKGLAVVGNQQGRARVASIAGDRAWLGVALARLPVALLLAWLAYLA